MKKGMMEIRFRGLGKTGQIKIQEMAFVLIALVVLASLVFVFSIKFQSGRISNEAEILNQKRALSLRDKIAFLPEVKCAGMSCVDRDKVNALKGVEKAYLKDLFQGLSEVKIVKIYPNDEEVLIYDDGKEDKTGYSSFINLCELKKTGGQSFDYECGLALLVVSI